MFFHKSVMVHEVLDALSPAKGGIFVDGTLGLGGHAKAILEHLAPKAVVGFDCDAQALDVARKNLIDCGDRITMVHDNFKNIRVGLEALGIAKVQGLLLDLGVSSMQLDDSERGFSFRLNGPLDMRMDRQQGLTASTVVNSYPEYELADLIWKFGQERYSRRIAKAIVFARSKAKIQTAEALSKIIHEVVGGYARAGRLDAATRTFQAIRIAVNRETESLESFFAQGADYLDHQAHVVVIAFHSLEDRIVKNVFRDWKKMDLGDVLTKKPLRPSDTEVHDNPRARSARLRVFRKA